MKLSTREKRLLLLCGLTVFVIVNVFAIRFVAKTLGTSKSEIADLKVELAEQESWMFDRSLWEQRREWLATSQPAPFGSTIRAQGDLIQQLQDELFDRQLKIERQSLVEPQTTGFYDEVAVNLRIRGEAAVLLEWLTTIQQFDRFVAIKALELEYDRRSREVEPQAECDITIARWNRLPGSAPAEVEAEVESEGSEEPEVEPEAAPEKASPAGDAPVEVTEATTEVAIR